MSSPTAPSTAAPSPGASSPAARADPGRLVVDYGHLSDLSEGLKRSLAIIGTELEDSVVLATGVGDGQLAARVVTFTQSWNKHRFDIRDSLQWLHDSVDTIQQQLAAADAELAGSLAGGAGGQP